ncbi:DMT family transporter [Rhodoferax sp.]|uniref:DMT family transporter n=1 Tax=Rhodoferax sp. TaxID=50421 RepID=UPI0025D2FD32|nr:DMT family transporter [Rhodoferax sp.]
MALVDTEQVAPKSIATGVTLAVAGSIAFSGKAIIVKLAYRYPGVDAVSLIMLRMLMALPFFLGLVWWSGYRTRKAGRAVEPLSGRDKLGILGLGFTGYYLASYLDFAGLAYISASLERLILYLNPTLVVLLGVVLYGKKVTLPQGLGMAISYGGVLLVFGHEASFAGGDAALGAALVLGSAISYALYLSYSGEMVQRLGSLRLVGLATSVACVLCIAQFGVLRPLDTAFAVAPQVLWLSLLNAIACTVVPVMLVMMAIERIGSGLAAQVGMVGPMSTILMGVLLLGEPMNLWVIGGTMLVLLGVYVVTSRR